MKISVIVMVKGHSVATANERYCRARYNARPDVTQFALVPIGSVIAVVAAQNISTAAVGAV